MVVFRARPDAVGQLSNKAAGRWSRVESVGAAEADGWVRVQMRFELEEDACAFTLSFGPRLELLEPAELRREVAALLGAAAALYVTLAPDTNRQRQPTDQEGDAA